MKRCLFLLTGLLVLAHETTQANDVSGHTFFYVRPVYQSCAPDKTVLFRDRALAREDGLSGAFQIVPLGGRSTRQKELNRFFGPWPKDEFLVVETPRNDPNFSNRDINANLFNIETVDANFQSRLKFKPQQTIGGVGITHRQYLHKRTTCDKTWWLEYSTPIIVVKNDVNIEEEVIIPGTPLPNKNKNIEQAFTGVDAVGTTSTNQVIWQFGKINGSKKKTRPADIEFKVGYTSVNTECCYLEGYLGVQIPTSNVPKGEFVFEPIVGHNGHWGFMTGWAVANRMWCSCDKNMFWELEMNTRYMFRRDEVRSFDLKDKPWSRYMPVYKDRAAAENGQLSPGINVFTREIDVDPRWSFNLNSGIVYNGGGFQAEIGYNIWTKQAEKIELRDPLPADGPAIPDALVENVETGKINRARTIKDNFTSRCQQEGDCAACNLIAINVWQDYRSLTDADLNLNSAAMPSALTNTVYASLGYRWDCLNFPTFAGFGGSYEFTGENTAINRWIVWGKVGMSY